MSWFIDADINNGYPWNSGFPSSFRTDFYSDDTIRLPDISWRIKSGVNNGYPWIWWMFKEDTSTGGEMTIGGSKTNYPNGLSNHNTGGIVNQGDDRDMAANWPSGYTYVVDAVSSALNGRMWLLSGGTLKSMVDAFNDPDIFDSAAASWIQSMYGANVYDSILSCKIYPYEIADLAGTGTGTIKAFNKYDLVSATPLDTVWHCYTFGGLHVDVQQAYEVENAEYQIYLPFSGIYPLDIRGNCNLFLLLSVDYLNGVGDYYLYIDNQLYSTYKCLLGTDMPINLSQGQMQSNFISNATSFVTKGIGSIAGGLIGGPIGAALGSSIGGSLSNTLDQHYAVNAQAIGGLSGLCTYPRARIIAKVPKMHKDAYGYHELLGANRSTGYLSINTCSGFTQCQNYKCDIIVATDDEKAEIERLMNSGVFI